MKLTCYMCAAMLIFYSICGGIYAFSGFNPLYLLCFNQDVLYRSFLAVNAVAALFTVYSLIAFKPFKGLK